MKKLFLLSISLTQPVAKKVEAKVATQPPAKKTTKAVTKPGLPKVEQAVEAVAPIKESATTESIQPQVVAPAPPPAPLLDPNKNFEFKNDAYDFGKIPAGKQAKYELFIKNISSETQELTLVQPGCGCTTPEYQQNQKILPGESAKIVLGYNGGAPGSGSPFSKSVTVTLKGHSPKVVTFKGETYAVPTESAPANNGTEKLKPEGGK
ncbi:MAG: DUF1573 domain-containing protein [Bacteroidetes bacterium]|nr:DUF1573 domain-containing protein [Bacteroidota bacterium]